MTHTQNDNIRKAVREQYGKVAESDSSGCGGTATLCCDESGTDTKTASMALGYSNTDVNQVPDGANMGWVAVTLRQLPH